MTDTPASAMMTAALRAGPGSKQALIPDSVGGAGGDGAIQTKEEKKCNAVQLLVKQTTWRAARGKRERTKNVNHLLAKLSFNKGSSVRAGEGEEDRQTRRTGE